MGIPKVYGDYRELLEVPKITVVHNCTPNHLHYNVNKDIILAGKHVLSEKPLAVSSRKSRELLQLAQKHNVVHGINFNYRQYPIVQQLRTMVHQQQLGKVNLVHSSYLQNWLLYETDYNWRLDAKTGVN